MIDISTNNKDDKKGRTKTFILELVFVNRVIKENTS